MRTGRPTLPLTPPEHDTLERWARRCTTTQALAQRARLILWAARAGQLNHVVAQQQRLKACWTSPAQVLLRRITYAHVEHVVTRTLETRPPDAMHWSSRAMATTTHLS